MPMAKHSGTKTGNLKKRPLPPSSTHDRTKNDPQQSDLQEIPGAAPRKKVAVVA
jgi:hypothetical protein